MTADAGSLDSAPAAQVARRPWGRRILMLALPIVLAVVGTYVWLSGGGSASTDNAYVQQNLVAVSTDVAGRIAEVAVHENDRVAEGQLLFRLDPEPYELKVEQADAAIASARLRVDQLRAAYQQSMTQKRAADQNLAFYQSEFDRTQKLATGGNTTEVKLAEARHAVDVANQGVATASSAQAAALTALGGKADIATDAQPMVVEALAQRNAAAYQLSLTTIVAPRNGIVSQTARLQVGQYVAAGAAVMSVVGDNDFWIEANFKETDLTHMTVGQTAIVTFDSFPGREFTATVDSIGAATGAQFSVLPAQNATGNWVKVVQRVPVRVRLTQTSGEPLRIGMSARVEVITGFRRKLPNVFAAAGDVIGGLTGNTARP